MGSPPQMETTGAPHSSEADRHCSTVIISLIVDLYSRIRPHPVHVKLQACKGSSIITIGNLSAPRRRWVATYFARFAVIFNGYLINSPGLLIADRIPGAALAMHGTASSPVLCCDNAPAHKEENNSGTSDISIRTRTEIPCRRILFRPKN